MTQNNSTKNILKFISFILVMLMFINCGQPGKIRAGSICTIDDGGGKFRVVKVLVIDDQEAHVRIYSNRYEQRPAQVDLKTLSLGSVNDKDGFGIGHVPLERKVFDNWKPIVIGFEEVTKEDLEGYEIWKNQ